MYDTIIRGAQILDGRGGAAFSADVAISDGLICEVGKVSSRAKEEINADGALLTPGFIDLHTHYDGQFIWDDRLDPSFSHGVTTAIGGNCGVGFAPAHPHLRKPLIEMMEGVEEIPGIVLDTGLDWTWTSFPEYLDRLAARNYTMDIACHLTHAPLRVFVMGERAIAHERATSDDIDELSRLTREAMDAGAIGFSSGRIMEHMSTTGAHVPGTFANDEELLALAKAMGSSGHGVFQIIPFGAIGTGMGMGTDRNGRMAEHRRMESIARTAGRPLTYSALEFSTDPDDRRAIVAESDRAIASGLAMHPQVAARGLGTFLLLDGHHPFVFKPAYLEIAHLPLAHRAAAMRQPDRRSAILSQDNVTPSAAADMALQRMLDAFAQHIGAAVIMTTPVDYEPAADKRLVNLAAQAGQDPLSFAYDHLTAGDGENGLVMFTLNYTAGNLDQTREMLANPNIISGLGDGGAHVKLICDASMPTFTLSFWGRDRVRGATLPLEYLVRKMTHDAAKLYGLNDRGVIAPGMKADLNVIDYDRLAATRPKIMHDLPCGGARIHQGSVGYALTMVNGKITRRDDVDTGERPGRLIRGGRN